jgi:hypothetical protein
MLPLAGLGSNQFAPLPSDTVLLFFKHGPQACRKHAFVCGTRFQLGRLPNEIILNGRAARKAGLKRAA